MQPSEVRKIIREEHDQVLALASRARQGGLESVESMAKHLGGLVTYLGEHINHEEAHLFPILRLDTNWAEVNEAELVQHHQEQRKGFLELTRAVADATEVTAELSERFLAFLDHVEADVNDENEHILTHQMLHNEPEADGLGG